MFKLLTGSYRNYHKNFDYVSIVKKQCIRESNKYIRISKMKKSERLEKLARFLFLNVTKAVN